MDLATATNIHVNYIILHFLEKSIPFDKKTKNMAKTAAKTLFWPKKQKKGARKHGKNDKKHKKSNKKG